MKKLCLPSIGILLVFAIVFTVFAPSFASSTGREIQTSLKETDRNSYYALVAGNLIASFPKVLIQTEFGEKEIIAYPPEYAGAYIDGSNTLHIVLTKNANTTTKLNYLEIMGNDEDIIFDIVDFPLSHLCKIQRTLTGAMQEQKFSIERIGINEITNKVEIHPFDSITEQEITEFLKNKFNDFDVRCITFKDPLGIISTATDTIPDQSGSDNTLTSIERNEPPEPDQLSMLSSVIIGFITSMIGLILLAIIIPIVILVLVLNRKRKSLKVVK